MRPVPWRTRATAQTAAAPPAASTRRTGACCGTRRPSRSAAHYNVHALGCWEQDAADRTSPMQQQACSHRHKQKASLRMINLEGSSPGHRPRTTDSRQAPCALFASQKVSGGTLSTRHGVRAARLSLSSSTKAPGRHTARNTAILVMGTPSAAAARAWPDCGIGGTCVSWSNRPRLVAPLFGRTVVWLGARQRGSRG